LAKSPRFAAVLTELLRPLHSSTTHDGLAVGAHDDASQNAGPSAWIFTDRERSQAIVIAVGGSTSTNGDVRRFTAPLRWLDATKTDFVTDMSLDDIGTFASAFVGGLSGRDARPVAVGPNELAQGEGDWVKSFHRMLFRLRSVSHIGLLCRPCGRFPHLVASPELYVVTC
jgi:hypothetical protein